MKRIVLLVEDQDQVDAVLEVLTEAEENGELDFSFGTTVEDEDWDMILGETSRRVKEKGS